MAQATGTAGRATSNRGPSAAPKHLRSGRRARLGLLLLLLLTVFFAAGAIYVKFQLESYRAALEQRFADVLGAKLSMGTVSINGFRGLRVDRVRIDASTKAGPAAEISVPVAFIDININQLFYGQVVLDRITVDNATVAVERPPGAAWYTPDEFNLDVDSLLDPEQNLRITGKSCTIDVLNVVGDTHLDIDRIDFDIARPAGAPHLTAGVSGDLSGDAAKRVSVELTLASLEDFFLQVHSTRIAADDVNVFLPAEHRLVDTGHAEPSLTLTGSVDNEFIVTLRSSFQGLVIRDQPDFLGPANGSLIAHATYSTDTRRLDITAARAESEELGGTLDGSVRFDNEFPVFDLRLKAGRLPVSQLISHLFDGQVEDYGTADLVLNEPHELFLALEGTSDAPLLRASLTAGSGQFSFVPSDADSPAIALDMGKMEGAWDSTTEALSGEFAILAGTVQHEATGISAEGVYGNLVVKDGMLTVSPMNARVTGNDYVGQLTYDSAADTGKLVFSGVLAGIEDTFLHDAIKDTHLAGAIHIVECAVEKQGGQYVIDARLDGTQASVDHAWWFRKPPGIGVTGQVHATVVPNQSATIEARGFEVASSIVDVAANLRYSADRKQKWSVTDAQATSNRIDINGLAKCLRIPYRVNGGTVTEAAFEFAAKGDAENTWRETIRGRADELTLLPGDPAAEIPISFKGLAVETTLTRGSVSTGAVKLRATEASVPPLDAPWSAAWDRTNPSGEQTESPEREWTFDLGAEALDLPPWKGRDFVATASNDPLVFAFHSYEAKVDEGRIGGSYTLNKSDNVFTSKVNWTGVPSHYILRYLKYTDILSGTMTGGVTYTMDRDDRGTLEGQGEFEIADGQFSADFIYSILEGRMGDEAAALPPSLRFSRVSATGIALKGDRVETPSLLIVSDGVKLNGDGFFIREGDLNYTINVAVAPDMAERIPALRDNFNIQGLRVTGQDLPLSFKIDGPTFNPQGRLETMPGASVTLVSGAAGVTKGIIDAPRRILVDLLKMAGGIIGGAK